MRKLILLASGIITMMLLLSSCQMNKFDEHEYLLSGKHELRKFNVKESATTTSRGSWFLVVGSYESQTKTESKVRFYFKTRNDEYVFKELDFEKVVLKIDSTAKVPYVKFYWNNCGCGYHPNDMQIYERAITRAVIYCKEEDFAPEININDLK